jgi:hypothetical protein
MRVNRRFLYAGVVFLAIGGVLVAADLRALDTATLADALRVWPIAVLAVGLGLVLRGTQVGLPAGMLAAAIPGLVLGSALAVAPRFAGDCGARGEPTSTATAEGTFDGPATVSVRSGCGSLNVTTASGNGWHLAAANTAGRTPTVDSSAGSLSIPATSDEDTSFLDAGRDAWDLTLPTTEIGDLSLVVHGSHSQVTLPGAPIGTLTIAGNASQVVVDASAASVADLAGVVNVGSLSIDLPAEGDLVGSLRIGGGELRVCTSPGAGLHVTTRGRPGQLSVDGVERTGSEWQSPDYAAAAHHADLRVTLNFGSVEINPIGGCK